MRPLLLAGALALAIAAPASAQFKLPKVKIKSPLASAGSSSAVRTGDVQFDESVLEINGTNMARFLKGLAAEQDAATRLEAEQKNGAAGRNAKKREAYERADADYQARSQKREACAAPYREQGQQEMDAYSARMDKDNAAIQKVGERVRAAAAAGNMAEVKRLSDSIAQVAGVMTNQGLANAGAANKRISDKCGAEPQEPAKPDYEAEMTGEDVRAAGLKASGMTGAQYAIMRERILPYVQSKGKSSAGTMFTGDEVAVLNDNLDNLAPYLDLLQRY